MHSARMTRIVFYGKFKEKNSAFFLARKLIIGSRVPYGLVRFVLNSSRFARFLAPIPHARINGKLSPILTA